MAQYTGKSPSYFDSNWNARILFAARILTSAQDAWLQTDSPFPSERIAAVIFCILGISPVSTWRSMFRSRIPDEYQRRNLDEWLTEVRNVVEECQSCIPAASTQECVDACTFFIDRLDAAAISWTEDPMALSSYRVVLDLSLIHI